MLCGQGFAQTCFPLNLCSLICMTWIHLMDQHSLKLCTVNIVDDVAQTKIIDDAWHTRSVAKERIIIVPAFLNSYKVGRQHHLFTKDLLVITMQA